MNQWQACQQIAHLLRIRQWDGTGDKVFRRVVVTAGIPEQVVAQMGVPFAIVRPGPETYNAQTPDIVDDSSVDVTIVTDVPNDGLGTAALVGGARPSLSTSKGRGVPCGSSFLVDVAYNTSKTAASIGASSSAPPVSIRSCCPKRIAS